MVFENYIPQVSFALSTVIVVFLSDYIFRGGKGWIKRFIKGHRFSQRNEGFLFFFMTIVILIPVFTIGLQSIFNDIFTMQKNNVDIIVVLFVVVFYLFFSRKFYKKWF